MIQMGQGDINTKSTVTYIVHLYVIVCDNNYYEGIKNKEGEAYIIIKNVTKMVSIENR